MKHGNYRTFNNDLSYILFLDELKEGAEGLMDLAKAKGVRAKHGENISGNRREQRFDYLIVKNGDAVLGTISVRADGTRSQPEMKIGMALEWRIDGETGRIRGKHPMLLAGDWEDKVRELLGIGEDEGIEEKKRKEGRFFDWRKA